MAWGDRAVTPSHGTGSDDDEEHDYQQADASQTNLHQHLCNQLSLTPLGARDRQLVGLLIEALDEDGYLSASLEELVELFPAEMEVDLPELSTALKLLQSFDPTGIGARDLGECLWLQLKACRTTSPIWKKPKPWCANISASWRSGNTARSRNCSISPIPNSSICAS
jgi:RNA polymerase sigma-54 factor